MFDVALQDSEGLRDCLEAQKFCHRTSDDDCKSDPEKKIISQIIIGQ